MNFKTFSSFDKKLLLGALTFLILFSFLLFNDHILINLVSIGSQKIAQITSVKNDVRIKYSSDFRWTPISKGAVHIGDYLFTGPKGSASIRFDDGSSLEVEENSLIVFSVSNGHSTLILKQGNLSGSTNQIRIEKSETMASHSPSKLPSSVATVETSRPIITEPPTYSQREIPFSMEEPFLPQKNEIKIQWNYSNDATAFEVEIAKDSLFNQMEKIITIHKRTIISPHLAEGTHFIRVRAKDKIPKRWSRFVEVEILKNKQTTATISTLEAPKEESHPPATSNGSFGKKAAKITLPIPPPLPHPVQDKTLWSKSKEDLPTAPTLLDPKDQSAIFFQTAKNISFYMSWEPIPDVSSYVVEIAKDSNFKNLLFHQKINKNRFLFSGISNLTTSPLLNSASLSATRQPTSESPKTIYWRVKTIKGLHSSPWSKTRKATIYSGRL